MRALGPIALCAQIPDVGIHRLAPFAEGVVPGQEAALGVLGVAAEAVRDELAGQTLGGDRVVNVVAGEVDGAGRGFQIGEIGIALAHDDDHVHLSLRRDVLIGESGKVGGCLRFVVVLGGFVQDQGGVRKGEQHAAGNVDLRHGPGVDIFIVFRRLDDLRTAAGNHRADGCGRTEQKPDQPPPAPAELPTGEDGEQGRHAHAAGQDGKNDAPAELKLVARRIGDGKGLADAGQVGKLQGVVADDDQIIVPDGHAQAEQGGQAVGEPESAQQGKEQQADPHGNGIVEYDDQGLLKIALENIRREVAVGQQEGTEGQDSAGDQQQKQVPACEGELPSRSGRHAFLQQQRRFIRRALAFFRHGRSSFHYRFFARGSLCSCAS